MNRTTNATADYLYAMECEDKVTPFFRPPGNISYFVVELLIFTSGFIGNIVTVAVISCWRKLHTPTFTMIACLAVSDAYSLLYYTLYRQTNVWLLILCYEFVAWMYSFPMTFVTFNVFLQFARFNGGMQLCLLACLRFSAIVYPLKYQAYCTCKAVIVLSAVTSVIILMSSAVESTLHVALKYNCAVRTPLVALNFIVPTTVFISLHCLKLRALRRSPALNNTSSWRMNVVLIVLMSVYVMSSTSILIASIVGCIIRDVRFLNTDFDVIITTSLLLNCAVNPFIYFFSSPPIVQLFRKVWNRLCNSCQVTENANEGDIEINNIPTARG